MPQIFENLPPIWDDNGEECEHVSLTCPRTITCKDGTLVLIITSLEWTSNYDFWKRVTTHPEENPNILNQINIKKHHPLLKSLSEALNDYVKFPESHLNSHQLHIVGELLEFFSWEDIPSKMANTHLAYSDSELDKFSGTDPDQDAEAFIRLKECKIYFALGTEPDEANDAHVINLFRKKALFSSLLRGPAAERYGSTIQDAMTWNEVRTLFITRFSDGRNKFRHRMEVEQCIRADGEEIRNSPHRIKKTVDKGWPDNMVGMVAAEQTAERTAQARQRRQRYSDYTLERLIPRYLQRKAQEYLMEHPIATWNDISTHIINKDLSYQVSTSFLNDEEQNKAQTASLGQEIKNLRTDLKEHKINALEGNQKLGDPNQKWRQNATKFCGFCRTNGHTPNFCRRKMRVEEIKKLQNEATAEKRLLSPKNITRDEDLPTDPGIGLDGMTMMGLWCPPQDHLLEEISGQLIGTLTTSDETDISNEETIRITIIIGIKNTEQILHTSRTKINLGIGEVTMTIPDRLQRHDTITPSQISADNPDQTRPILQCLTGLEFETRATKYLTIRNSLFPTMVTSQT